MVTKVRKVKRNKRWHFYKEVVMAVLALASVALLVYEYSVMPSAVLRAKISNFDFVVAIVFLADFTLSFILSSRKKHFFAHNWYILFASIPLANSWTEALRGLRILGLVRLIRAGEHLNYVISKR